MKNKFLYISIIVILAVSYYFGIFLHKKEAGIAEPQKQIHQDQEFTKRAEYVPDPNAPKFEDYPAGEKFNGKPVAPDFSTNLEAKMYYTKITEGAKFGPSFAGEYSVIIYGCGFGCQYNTIVNSRTGKIIAYNIESNRGTEYYINSRLLVVNPPKELYESYGDEIPSYVSTQYYYLSENGEELIKL